MKWNSGRLVNGSLFVFGLLFAIAVTRWLFDF